MWATLPAGEEDSKRQGLKHCGEYPHDGVGGTVRESEERTFWGGGDEQLLRLNKLIRSLLMLGQPKILQSLSVFWV